MRTDKTRRAGATILYQLDYRVATSPQVQDLRTCDQQKISDTMNGVITLSAKSPTGGLRSAVQVLHLIHNYEQVRVCMDRCRQDHWQLNETVTAVQEVIMSVMMQNSG